MLAYEHYNKYTWRWTLVTHLFTWPAWKNSIENTFFRTLYEKTNDISTIKHRKQQISSSFHKTRPNMEITLTAGAWALSNTLCAPTDDNRIESKSIRMLWAPHHHTATNHSIHSLFFCETFKRLLAGDFWFEGRDSDSFSSATSQKLMCS